VVKPSAGVLADVDIDSPVGKADLTPRRRPIWMLRLRIVAYA
jgi:hypothetical protein